MLNREGYEMVPEDTLDSLERYAEYGIPTGGFLQAVLENRLMEAMGRADHRNARVISEIAAFIYNEMPGPCHGNRENWNDWIKRGGLRGHEAPALEAADGEVR